MGAATGKLTERLSSHEFNVEMREGLREREETRGERTGDAPKIERLRDVSPSRLGDGPQGIAAPTLTYRPFDQLAGKVKVAPMLDMVSAPQPKIVAFDGTFGAAATDAPRARATPPPLGPYLARQAQEAKAKRAGADNFVEMQRRDAALKAYRDANPKAKGMPVQTVQVEKKIGELRAVHRDTLLRGIRTEGIGAVRQGFADTLQPKSFARSTVEAVLQKSAELDRQGKYLEQVIPAGEDHEVITGVLETARENLAKTMAGLKLDGSDRSVLPLVDALAEMQDAVDLASHENFDANGKLMMKTYKETLYSLRSHARILMENPGHSLHVFEQWRAENVKMTLPDAEKVLRAAAPRVFSVLETGDGIAIAHAQAAVLDATTGSKTRLIYRLHDLQTKVAAAMQNPAASAEAKAGLRSYGHAITQMLNAANF